uniref:RING-H2 finger protein ATL46-like isoform X2 n=1 Tax=Erigeron canadensis TaxID=72917 RepID=UPI001CB90DD8|nr:RING-H2 finger protein ATL46-like isoform X2 [Erigeron canadensis]
MGSQLKFPNTHKQNTFSPPVYAPPSNSTLVMAKNIVIIVVVVVVMLLMICGVLHFLMRYLMNKIRLCSNSQHESTIGRFQENSTEGDVAVYQRQLQQLFTLHDSGLDQSSIDALPVFVYKELVGFKEDHHCAVCLCAFTEDDNLRLLPVCSHAFHTHCIDTWLLSNSTCPLCRGSLFTPGFTVVNPVFDFDFDLDYSREEEEEDDDHGVSNNLGDSNTHDGHSGHLKQCERVYPVKLGKFRAINVEKRQDKQQVGQTSNGYNLDERRCYSMGSYEYVVANSDLQVAFFQDTGRTGNSDLRIEKDKVKQNSSNDEARNGKVISNGSKGESFSASKIWLWSKKDNHNFQHSSVPMWSNPLSVYQAKQRWDP